MTWDKTSEEMIWWPIISSTVRRVTPGDGESAPYHAGRLPPNYPVPAIPIYVYLGYDEVFTVEQHDDGQRGDWGWQKPVRYFR
jgi:hypothetical protein